MPFTSKQTTMARAAIYAVVAVMIGWYAHGISWKARGEYDFYGFAWLVLNGAKIVGYVMAFWFALSALAAGAIVRRQIRASASKTVARD